VDEACSGKQFSDVSVKQRRLKAAASLTLAFPAAAMMLPIAMFNHRERNKHRITN